MILYQCDGCGRQIPKDALRYTVSVDVRAAYDREEIGLADLVRDHRRELLDLIEQLRGKSEAEIEESVYKRIQLDLCPACQRAFVRNPMRFQPGEQAAPAFDVDTFLRSLGYGSRETDEGA